MYFLLDRPGDAIAKSLEAAATSATPSEGTGTVRIVRDFTNSRLELVRLLKEAAEIEHSLMIQYLYAAFSLKSAYRGLLDRGDPNTNDLLGVAIQEMQHLADVNELLVELGAAPVLVRQDFSYEPDIYPFPLNLEPMSRESLAKYVYCEAPETALDRKHAKTPEDVAFLDMLDAALGTSARPNLIGSLYGRVIDTLEEFSKQTGEIKDLDKWVKKLAEIKDEGEDGHFTFFKAAFMGTHKAFKGRPDVWRLAKTDPNYPAVDLPTNPSAYVGHEHQIADPTTLSIAWLGNLQYWMVLMLLDVGYRHKTKPHREAAKFLMMGPFWSLSRFLPTRGAGMPFDQLSVGYSMGVDQAANMKFIVTLAAEIDALENQLKDKLPDDYMSGSTKQALDMIAAAPAQLKKS